MEPATLEPAAKELLPVRYTPTEAVIAELREQVADFKADSPAGYKMVVAGIATARGMRTEIERTRKHLKAVAIDYGRRVDSEAARLTGMIQAIEDPLRKMRDNYDAAKERAKQEALAAERAKVEAEIAAKREAEEAKLRAEREAEEARLKAERERLAKEQAAEQERLRQEREALAKERAALKAARDAELERQRVAQAAIDAENARVQAELESRRLAVIAEQERLARIEAERVAKERAEREAREREERERIEAERLEAERAAEAKRIEDAKPEVAKVRGYGKRLLSVEWPPVSSDIAKEFMAKVAVDLQAVARRCIEFKVK